LPPLLERESPFPVMELDAGTLHSREEKGSFGFRVTPPAAVERVIEVSGSSVFRPFIREKGHLQEEEN